MPVNVKAAGHRIPLSRAKNRKSRKSPQTPAQFLSPETGVRIPVAVLGLAIAVGPQRSLTADYG
jgi:hypothetical protein